MADQAINALSTKTAPETSDQLLLVGTGEPQLIDYDKLADAILNKITSKNYALDAGTMTLPAALNALNGNRVPWCKITHPNDNDALAKLNTPALLFGTGTDRPYTIIFEDSRGDSALGGGISVVYGFMYAMDAYGTQIAQHYSGVIRKRKKENNTWSDWSIIHD